MKKVRLFILRWLLALAFFVAARATGRQRFSWILHYLLGSGKDKWMPEDLVELQVIRKLCLFKRHYAPTTNGRKVHLWSSTMYPGKGFWRRPEMFYIVGCLTVNVEHKGNLVIISGEDVYDWHPTESGEYYTSPLPFPWMVRVLGWLFGKEYFPMAGFPMGQPGISNKLWEDLEQVGAKPFTTRFKVTVKSNEWRRLGRKIKREMGRQ